MGGNLKISHETFELPPIWWKFGRKKFRRFVVKTIGKFALLVVSLVASYFGFSFFFGSVFAILILTSAFLHELGHFFVLRIFGVKSKIVFIPLLGAAVIPDDNNEVEKLPWRHMAWVALMGPATNAALALIGILASNLPGLAQHSLAFASINASLAAFNLMPIWLLDGGKFIQMLMRSSDKEMDRVIVHLVTVFALMVGGYFLLSGNFTFYAAVMVFGVKRVAEKDNPEDEKSTLAMTRPQVTVSLFYYFVFLSIALFATHFLPSWSQFYK